jgi:hypothetical protein
MQDKAFYLMEHLTQSPCHHLQYVLSMIPSLVGPLLSVMWHSMGRATMVINTEKEGPDPPEYS